MKMEELLAVVGRMEADGRLGPAHISLYLAVLYLGSEQGVEDGITVSARTVMPVAKIRGSELYHRAMGELARYGYWRYEPSNDRRVGSRVWVTDF